MPALHNPQISPLRKYAGYTLSIIPSLLLVFSATMKLLHGDFMVQSMQEIKLLSVMEFIGLLEITSVVLYWIPKTMNLGFFLMCSFVGGILAAELIATSGQGLPIPGLPIALFLYIGTFLRKPELTGLNI